MKNLICILTVFLLSALVGRTNALEAAPKITVDMADAPTDRWRKAVKLAIQLKGWENSFGGFFNAYLPLLSHLPSFTMPILETIFKDRFHEQYLEMSGILDEIHSQGHLREYNMTTFGAVAFIYELSHINQTSAQSSIFSTKQDAANFGDVVTKAQAWEKALKGSVFGDEKACTGILSLPLDPREEIVHGRNLDESPKECRNFTLDITVVNNGTYLYNIFDYTWASTGMFTSNRVAGPGNNNQGLTLEENWRNDDNPSFEALMLRLAEPETVPIAFLFRHIQSQGMNFTAAAHYLLHAKVASPGYFIMSGTGRLGAVITLSFDQSKNRAQFINDTTATATATSGGGYAANWLVQTNYDFWKADPVNSRRWTAMNALEMVGNKRAGTELGVWMAISTFPVHNPNTLFTALMRPDRETEGYIRMAMEPGYTPCN